mmetsp:Transcript_16430/g.24746  ORF Transcript_16430/g.24746 Transcript_16430/m.24746 type:complete len:132 (+) Transcript_16430:321-716(+)
MSYRTGPMIVGWEGNRMPVRHIRRPIISLGVRINGKLRTIRADSSEKVVTCGLIVEEAHRLINAVQEEMIMSATLTEIRTGKEQSGNLVRSRTVCAPKFPIFTVACINSNIVGDKKRSSHIRVMSTQWTLE